MGVNLSSIKFFFLLISIFVLIATLIFNYQNSSKNITSKYTNITHSIIDYSLTEKVGHKWLKELCAIGPRLSGSVESELAINWAVNKFKEINCDTVWLQPVMVPRWVRGIKESAIISKSLKFAERKLNIASLGGSVGTDSKNVAGQVFEIKKFEDLKNIDISNTKGKIFFFNEPFDETFSNTFEAYGKAVQQRVYGVDEAAKLGAIAVVVRSVTSKYDNIPHVGTLFYSDSVKRIPGVSIGVQDADFLSNLLKEEPFAEISLDIDCHTLPDVVSYNVIAEIRGNELPEEIIVVGGHLDSWDKGCGAQDAAAPCIQTMEVLHQLKTLGLHPKRTIRCVLFTNEENGLKGAIKYGEYSAVHKEKHVAAIESDRGVFEPRGFYVEAESEIIGKMEEWLPLLMETKIDWIKKGGSGADISRIKGTSAKIGFAPDDQKYFDYHHSDNDIFETVNPREMQLGTAAITLLAYLISEEGL